jgi:glycosyltransferase involved in cell wall biosynthesis
VGLDVPIVLSAGRLEEPKDQSTLLRAWRVVAASHPDALLVIVGSGSLESRLRGEIAAHAAGRSIRLIGPRATLAEAYADADVFALSSRWEGLPYVLLEAMACGLPVASTNVDGIPEAVVDEVSGLLVPPQEPTALGTAIERLVADPELRGRLGAAGRERVGVEFTLERMIARVAGAYRELAGPRPPT